MNFIYNPFIKISFKFQSGQTKTIRHDLVHFMDLSWDDKKIEKVKSDNDVLVSAAKSTSYTIGMQLVFRIITFGVNVAVVRYISKDMLGLVHVRLTLLYTTIFTLTSEPFVRSCLSKTTHRSWPQVINLLWCSFPIGIFWSIVCGSLWLYYLEQPDASITSDYRMAVVCYSLSAVIELSCQPLFVSVQILLLAEVKAAVEGIALALQCLVTVILVINFPSLGLKSFCIAQMLYTSTISVLYYVYMIRYIKKRNGENFLFPSIWSIFPKYVTGQSFVSKDGADLVWSFSKQSVLKQLLTEGEKYVMTVFDVLSFADQGVYSVVNNLGSLVVRIVFLPMEDGFYLFVSQTLHRGIDIKQQSQESVKLVSQALRAMLQIRVLLGVTVATFGFAFSYLALDIIYGNHLSTEPGPSLLRWNCLYIFLVSVNGITEGFQNAAMHQTQVDRYNRMMLFYSFVFLVSSWFLTSFLAMGAVGFFLSNCLNMILRICYSIHFIYKFFKGGDEEHPLKGILPSPIVMLTYFIAFMIMSTSEIWFCRSNNRWSVFHLLHIFIGGLCLIFVAAVIFIKERTLIRFVHEQYLKKKKRTEISKTN